MLPGKAGFGSEASTTPIIPRFSCLYLDMAMNRAYIIDMKIAHIAELKNHLSSFLALVEAGEEIEVRKRNIPIAKIIHIDQVKKNNTILGCGKGSVKINGDLTEPFLPLDYWEMLRE
ncbi:MAG: type II toxin-antitoxin system prevent-host-death family antitoxin [Spirochaetales bacterium]|nr:type II toxin-antitoxin system prevent-host-death family antitoxin [Spirochaetales bacterium]